MLKRRIAAFSVAIMVAICLLVVEAVVSNRNAALDRARVEAANLSAGFEEQIRGTLDGIKGAMEFLKRRIEAEGPTFNLAQWKSQIPELVSPTINILMIDADGKLVASSIDSAPNPNSYSDREYFQAHRDNPDLGFFLGPPHIGRIAQRLVISATRRLETKDGHFAGVLVFSIDPELLTTLHQKVNPGKTAAINLVRTDGTTLARYTPALGLDRSRIGVKLQGLPEIIEKRAGDSGEYTRPSPVDGTPRLHHWRKVQGYPLIVIVGLGEPEVFAAANHQARIVIGLGIAALCLPLIMMIILNREISRRVDNAIALDNESGKVRKEHRALLAITEELAKERIKLHKTNTELNLARRLSEEANQAKTAFLANMSHELRTPLNAILGFSEIIRDKLLGEDAGRYASYAADIHRSGAHLLNIVNDILDITKIEAGKLDLREEKVKVKTVIEESLVAVATQAATGGIELTGAVPDIGASILGDGTKLKQIVINLLSNAIKFTPRGGSVEVIAAPEKDGLSLTIRDTGIGMSGDEIRDALELFRQVDNSLSRRFEGTGLGLPLAVQLAELHGGTLTVESSPGMGTTVVVRFPARRIIWKMDVVPKRISNPTTPLKIAS
jgi:two-component system, cell cycle sensor histidine kinase PleC